MKTEMEKKQTGTYRKDQDGTQSLTLLEKVPPPPKEFSKYEREFYLDTCTDLLNRGTLTTDSARGVEYHAIWYHVHKDTSSKIRKGNYYQVSEKTGWENISPDVSLCEKATKILMTLSNANGLNPVAGSKVRVKPRKRANDLDILINK